MDSTAFRCLVERVVAVSPTPLTFAAAASNVARTLTSFPDGITHGILLSSLPKAPSPVSLLHENQHVAVREVVDLVVKRIVNPRMLELSALESAKIVLHAPGGYVHALLCASQPTYCSALMVSHVSRAPQSARE